MPNFLELLIGGAIAGVGFSIGSSGAQQLRPLMKGAIRGYLTLAEQARETAAGLGETMEDLVAEAKAEIEAESKAAPNQRAAR